MLLLCCMEATLHRRGENFFVSSALNCSSLSSFKPTRQLSSWIIKPKTFSINGLLLLVFDAKHADIIKRDFCFQPRSREEISLASKVFNKQLLMSL